MTSLPSSSRLVLALRRASLLAVVAGAFVLTSCEDKHIGRPCDIGVDMSMIANPNLATVNPSALECPSRLCLLPAEARTTETKPFCTDECGSDDDCSDGERRGGSNTDFRCKEGFVCRIAVPKLASNPLSCKPVCVCRDFLLTEDIERPSKPPSCP